MMPVALSGKKGAGRVTRIDDADWPLVKDHRWRLLEKAATATRRGRGPYAQTSVRSDDGRWVTVLMHTMLTGWPQVDHIDHDGLNNQRSNLRPATAAQNQQNRRRRIGNSSRYKGVCRFRHTKWMARISINGTQRHLGLFATEEEAALAYNAAALEAYGEYAHLNQVEAGEAQAA